MGEGSPKSLRGGGMDDVIFAGTATPPAARFRRSLDPPRARPVPKAARSAKARSRAGSSAAPVRPIGSTAATSAPRTFACCSPTPRRARIRRRWSARARIGSIIAAKPTERRLLLEEAAGISGLHARRKDAEQKLRATEANLARLGELLVDQEQRAAQLRRQARAAERYRQSPTRSARPRRGWSTPAGSRPTGRHEAASRKRGRRRAVAALQGAMADARQAQDQAAAAPRPSAATS